MARTRSVTLVDTRTTVNDLYEVYHKPYADDDPHLETTMSGTHTDCGTVVNQSMTDVVTPNYKERIAHGEIINNPMTSHKNTLVYPGAQSFSYKISDTRDNGDIAWYRVSGNKVPTLYGLNTVIPGTAEISAMKTSVIDQAVTSAHANIDTSSMLALASAGEARKTVRSIASILSRVYSIFKSLRKLDMRRLKKEISRRELEDRYMEARYALRPLMYDVNGLVEGLQAQPDSTRRTFRGFASDTISGSSVLDTAQTQFHSIKMVVDNKWSYTVSARAGVLCDVQTSNITIWGLDKIPETIWELTPFSFIIDWFVNVGDTIGALTPNAGVKQRASWVTVKEEYSDCNSYHSPYLTGTWNVDYMSAPSFAHSWHSIVKDRLVEPTVSVFPTMSVSLDCYKLADLAIILKRLL